MCMYMCMYIHIPTFVCVGGCVDTHTHVHTREPVYIYTHT